MATGVGAPLAVMGMENVYMSRAMPNAHVILCGLDNFGLPTLEKLRRVGEDVMDRTAADTDMARFATICRA